MAVGRQGLVQMTTREQMLSHQGSIVSSFASTLCFLVLSRTGNKCDWALSDLLPLYLSLFLLNIVEFSWALPFFVYPLDLQSLHNFIAQLRIPRRWTWNCRFPEKCSSVESTPQTANL